MERLQIKYLRNPVASLRSQKGKKTGFSWAKLSLLTNVLLLITVFLLLYKDTEKPAPNQTNIINIEAKLEKPPAGRSLGPRQQWTYQQWVAQLEREANAVADNPPKRLTILAGDSISLWFPSSLLPSKNTWLNQGISGETSEGLLRRLPILDRTKPEFIFVMIGINDVLRGFTDEHILYNYRAIIQDAKSVHPESQIVVQSILPHSGAKATWEGRERLLEIPNNRILELNRKIATIASEEKVKYLDLFPLFANSQDSLRLDLTTDGLHLNDQGYLVWASALQLFSEMELNSPEIEGN
ncbi:MAG TPA: GDSL-type esterase/lipase family protein [Halomicronema sp.]